MSSHGPPPQIKELAEKHGYDLRPPGYYPPGHERPWLLLCWGRDLELSSQLEKIPLSPFNPDRPYSPRVPHDRWGEYIYLPHYPHFRLSRAVPAEVKEDLQEEELYVDALTDYTDGEPNWRVKRERLSDLIAERDDLQQQIGREGERLKVLLRDIRALLEVLYLEYKRAANHEDTRSEVSQTPLKRLTREMRKLYIRFFQWSRNDIEAQYETTSEHLQDAGVPEFLIRYQWDGIADLLDARDVVMEPMFRMNKKRVICEQLLNASRLDKSAPTWEEIKNEPPLPYEDESMPTTADGLFSANAVWYRWGRYIVNRVCELENQGINIRAEQARKISEQLGKDRLAELEDAGVAPGDFSDKQLNRVMKFHREQGFDAS